MLIRVLPCPVLAFLILQIAGCSSMSRMDRRLQTLTLAPAEATGHDSGTGQVSFTATGFFNAAPSPVTPLSVSSWLVSDPTIASVNQAGVAQCNVGATGMVTVKALASSGSDMPATTATVVTGAAQLTCP